MTTEEAIEVVAQHVAAYLAEDACDNWGCYPEIGEADWDAVIERLDVLVKFPPVDEYDEAYQILAYRANSDS